MNHESIDQGGWEITFTDMLTLLLTFFVFIISVSSFKAMEYNRLWESGTEGSPQSRAATTSFKFPLIKSLKLPHLTDDAEQLLNEIETVFTKSDFSGVDVTYDENKITLMVSEQLSFEAGKANLKPEAKILLLQLIDPINRSKFDLSIEGHSDTLTSPRINNMELSLDRALVVARFLLANGVEQKKISVAGYGPYRPIATNKTPEGRQLNRRVEINVIIRND
jgi:chemotaxis protein MotB